MANFHFTGRASRVPWLALSVLSACETGHGTTDPGDFPVTFLVTNALIAPVTISIDGVPYAILTNGKTTSFTVSSRAQWLTWSSAKPADPFGQPVPDDIGEVRISVSGINGALEIRNVIEDRTYFTARIFNVTSSPVSIGIYDGSVAKCAAALPGSMGGVNGFVQIGYYRLQSATEVRAYHDPGCTGPYRAWPRSQLTDFQAKSGLLVLALEAVP